MGRRVVGNLRMLTWAAFFAAVLWGGLFLLAWGIWGLVT